MALWTGQVRPTHFLHARPPSKQCQPKVDPSDLSDSDKSSSACSRSLFDMLNISRTQRSPMAAASDRESDSQDGESVSERSSSEDVTGINFGIQQLSLKPGQRKRLDFHMDFLDGPADAAGEASTAGRKEEVMMTPLFSGPVLTLLPERFPQHGLLGKNLSLAEDESHAFGKQTRQSSEFDPRVFLNVSTPWSAFICGSQGSGKSHTLSVLLESCLVRSKLGELAHPLTGIVFHWDSFNSFGSDQVCEAAYLCSAGIPVRVLVSPTNFWKMKAAYENLPGIDPHAKKPMVIPMLFRDNQLDIRKMMDMMSITDKEGPVPLYVEVSFLFPFIPSPILQSHFNVSRPIAGSGTHPHKPGNFFCAPVGRFASLI